MASYKSKNIFSTDDDIVHALWRHRDKYMNKARLAEAGRGIIQFEIDVPMARNIEYRIWNIEWMLCIIQHSIFKLLYSARSRAS